MRHVLCIMTSPIVPLVQCVELLQASRSVVMAPTTGWLLLVALFCSEPLSNQTPPEKHVGHIYQPTTYSLNDIRFSHTALGPVLIFSALGSCCGSRPRQPICTRLACCCSVLLRNALFDLCRHSLTSRHPALHFTILHRECHVPSHCFCSRPILDDKLRTAKMRNR